MLYRGRCDGPSPCGSSVWEEFDLLCRHLADVLEGRGQDVRDAVCAYKPVSTLLVGNKD